MTAAQAIAALDELTVNSYDFRQKLTWLQQVEDRLGAEVFFTPAPTLEESSLLSASGAYEELYLRYLQAQIHLEAGEITRCNNAMALFNTALQGLNRQHLRSHVTDHPQLTGM